MSYYDVLYIFSNIFLAHIINRFIHLFYEKCRINKYLEFLAYFIYFVSITFVFMHFGNPLITITFNIIAIFLFTLVYDYVNIKKSIIVTFIMYLFFVSIEISVLIIASFNIRYFYNPTQYKNIIVLLVVYKITYMGYFFLSGVKKFYFRKLEMVFTSKGFILFLIHPIMSSILIMVNFLINDNIILSIIFNFVIVVYNIIVFKYCDFILKRIHGKIFKKFIRDKANLYNDQIKVFKDYVNKDDSVNLNNNIIDSLVSSKTRYLDDNVELKIHISVSESLKINLYDLLIIIGNLVDNAVLGVKSTINDNDRYIFINIKYVRGIIILYTKSSFTNNMRKNTRLFFRVDEEDNHEILMLSIKEIVEKYNGTFDIKVRKTSFEVHVLIYDIEI